MKKETWRFGDENTESVLEVILVVDSSRRIRGMLRDSLESDYGVIEASNGLEGLEKAMSVVPDMVLTGVMIPSLNGLQLCKILKDDQRTSHIPVVFLTAKASNDQLTLGYESGADDFITWPYCARVLKARIKNLIRLRRNLRKEPSPRPYKPNSNRTNVNIDMNRDFVKRLSKVMDINISDPLFCVQDLCKQLVMSRTSLYRKVIALTGKSPQMFIRSFRLSRAAQMLQNNGGNVTEVAFKVGFTSAAYFTKCFKKMFHRLPSRFKG